MKSREVFWTSTAAGVLIGAVTWLLVRKATAPEPVLPAHVGESFPTLTGKSLTGQSITLPDNFAGRVGAVILADNYAARFEVEAWARHIMARYGCNPDLAYYQVALISGIGPIMRTAIDAAMVRGTPSEVQSHVMTVFGDLRMLSQRLGMQGRARASVFVIGRTGRIAWRMDGAPDAVRMAQFDEVLASQGISG